MKKIVYSVLGLLLTTTQLMAMGSRPADPNTPPPPAWVSMAPMVVMVVIFYFLLIRPQSQQRKERQRLIDSVKNGDKVLTSGGFYATVVNVAPGNDIVTVKLNEETKVRIQRSAITEILKDQAEVAVANGAAS